MPGGGILLNLDYSARSNGQDSHDMMGLDRLIGRRRLCQHKQCLRDI